MDSKKLFEKLEGDYEEFLKDKASSRTAINFSITAYHLYEWAGAELGDLQRDELLKKRCFISFNQRVNKIWLTGDFGSKGS